MSICIAFCFVTEVEQIAELGEVDTLLLLTTVQAQFDAKSRLLELKQVELDSVVTIAQLLGPNNVSDPAPISGPCRKPSGKMKALVFRPGSYG